MMETIPKEEFNKRLSQISKRLSDSAELAHAFKNLVQDNISMFNQIEQLQATIKQMRDIQETLTEIKENRDVKENG